MALFVDTANIRVKAGNGGNGCVSFHREKYVQAGGPDGGDGGKGGSIVFVATERMHTLMDFQYRRSFEAANGSDGMSNFRSGKAGEDLVIEVPPGTIVRRRDDGRLLLDMSKPGVRRVLMKGGNGGFGNSRFATPTRQAPRFAKPGERREAIELRLELKSIADVGLVGFPNVGKSTLLSVVTAARPKIANYHFTTLQPNLGIARTGDFSFVLADIPGLIEGAAKGAGLGHDFLRHVERTRMLIHVLDVSGSEGRDPISDYEAIRTELGAYGDLAERPEIIAANKIDLPDAEEKLEALIEHVKGRGVRVMPISAATGIGVDKLMWAVSGMLRELPPPEPFLEEEMGEMDQDLSYEAVRQDGGYVLSGSAIDRLIASVNFGDEESINYFHRSLKRMGAIDRLRELGAKEGDSVLVGDMEFDFVE